MCRPFTSDIVVSVMLFIFDNLSNVPIPEENRFYGEIGNSIGVCWSGQRDSNPHYGGGAPYQALKACVLPLHYVRCSFLRLMLAFLHLLQQPVVGGQPRRFQPFALFGEQGMPSFSLRLDT